MAPRKSSAKAFEQHENDPEEQGQRFETCLKSSSATFGDESSSDDSGNFRRDSRDVVVAYTPSEESSAEKRSLNSLSKRSRRIVGLTTALIVVLVIVLGVALSRTRTSKEESAVYNQANSANEAVTPSDSQAGGSSTVTGTSSTGTQTAPSESDNLYTETTPSVVLSLNKPIYDVDEKIVLPFTYSADSMPQQGDWIGIYPASDDSYELQNPTSRLYVCSEQFPCNSDVYNGSVTFGASGSEGWPLPAGLYKAYLCRNEQPPYTVIAEGGAFEVMDYGRMYAAIMQTRAAIEDMVWDDIRLAPKFVRLGFHDCVGGCDGCVDLTNPDNAGLDIPIQALEPVVQYFENKQIGFSRADIWALAALVGTDVTQYDSNDKVDYSMKWIGRVNCEDHPSGVCLDADGVERDCSATVGPHRTLPSPNFGTHDIFAYFNDYFGFTDEETVTIMGAHTIGTLTREHSGFDAPNGWVRDNYLLDNGYYRNLIGGSSKDDSMDNLVYLAPKWHHKKEDNSDLNGIPDRRYWALNITKADNPSETVELLMLNADVSLVRQLDGDNMGGDGKVYCTFNLDSQTESVCPYANRSIRLAAEYRFDNKLWMNDFHGVFNKVLHNGYDQNAACSEDPVCKMQLMQ